MGELQKKTVVPSRRKFCMELDDTRTAVGHWVHVQVRQVAATKGHEVAHRTEVWLRLGVACDAVVRRHQASQFRAVSPEAYDRLRESTSAWPLVLRRQATMASRPL